MTTATPTNGAIPLRRARASVADLLPSIQAVTAVIGNALRYVRHGTSRMPGGTIVVGARSDPDSVGHGTTVRITLPAA